MAFSNISIAQENITVDDQSNILNESFLPKFEFGVNTTSLIRNNLFDQKEIESYPYDFMMNFRIASKAQVRMAFKIVNSKFDDGDSRITNSNDVGFRFGICKNKKLAQNLLVYFGVDFLIEFNKRKTKVGTNSNPFETGSNRELYGIGPIVGIGYAINKHISVRIESELYYKYQLIKSTNTSSQTTKSKQTNFSFTPPINLLFYVSF